MSRFISVVVVFTIALGAGTARGQDGLPTDAQVLEILKDRVDVQHLSVGMVVGIVTPAGPRIVAYGKPGGDSAGDLDGDTIFEIGSITKVFTALLLSDMVERDELALSDPLDK